MVSDETEWYVQKGSRVLGPFSAGEIGRFLLLGRVRGTDRVSRDGELWEPVTQVPELVPEELLDLDADGGWSRFLAARASAEERETARPAVPERRVERDAAARVREEWRLELERSPQPPQSLLPWSLLGITLAALGVVVWLNASIAGGS